MPRHRTCRVPSYRLHRPSGLAVVRLAGRDMYLGRHGTPESHATYRTLVAEWLATRARPPTPAAANPTRQARDLTINELLLAYWHHAGSYYTKNGRPTSQLGVIKVAARALTDLYGNADAASFGPLALKTVRESLTNRGLKRRVINHFVSIIKGIFRWGAENELIPATTFHALLAVPGLRRGRCLARESEPVKPVPDAHIRAVSDLASPELRAMIQLQLLTGMRPSEVASMRSSEIVMPDAVWTYHPSSHKTEHHQKTRVIYLGPRAQEILTAFLSRDLDRYLFSPTTAEARRNLTRRTRRKSPMTPSQASRRRKPNPRRAPRERYDKDSYRRAIQRACDKAGVPRWSPNQLRHNAATFLRKEFGIDAARVILGHSSPAVTEVYAELDRSKAIEIMNKVG